MNFISARNMKGKIVFLVMSILALCFDPCNAMWYFKTAAADYTASTGKRNSFSSLLNDKTPNSAGSFAAAYLNARSGLGIGATFERYLFSSNYRWKENTTDAWTSSNAWMIERAAIDFYYAPYISKGIHLFRKDEKNIPAVGYFYVSLSPWARAFSFLDDSDSNYSPIDFIYSTAQELGIGMSLPLIEFRVGAAFINVPAHKDSNLDFSRYEKTELFFRTTLLSFWTGASPETVKTGWFPTYKERRETKIYERENSRPEITKIWPQKAVSGSTIEITGQNFRPEEENTKIYFSQVPGQIKIINATKATARIPSETPAGASSVVIETAKGASNTGTMFVLPARPPLLVVSDVSFNGNADDKVLRAGESGEITFTISNAKGAGKAFGIKLFSSLKTANITDLVSPNIIDIEDLDSGENRKVTVPLNAGLGLGSGEMIFSMKLTEVNDFGPNPFEVKIQTRKLEPPDLQLAKIEVDDKFYPDRAEKLSVGNGNSVVEPGESVEVSVTLLNRGTGFTKDTKIKIISESPDVTFLSPTEFASGNIQPGNWQDLKVAFSVKKGYKGQDELPIKIALSDARERFNKELPLNIKLKRSYPKTELVDIQGKEAPQKPVVMPSFGDELLAIPAAKTENTDAIAVVIGVQNYKNKNVPSVEYALNDAQLFKDYLQTALGYREGNIIYLENPTKADLEKVFGTSDNHAGQLSDYVKKDRSDVFVYYTGHGAPDLQSKKAYLVPSDADPNYVKLGGYPLDILYDNLSRLPARQISVVLDACFSGQSDKGMIISKASPLMIAPVLPGSGNIDLFSSSKADEVSSWYPEKRHSLFTYFFLKGLQGDADKNKDRAITVAELREYVDENVPYYARRLYGRNQNPAFTGQGEKVVARY